MSLSRSLTLGVVLCAALVAVWALGRASASQAERDTIASQAQANAQVAHKAYREARKQVAPALAQTDTVTRTVRARDHKVGTTAAALTAQLDSARALLTADSVTDAELLNALSKTTQSADALLTDVAAYRAAVDSLTVVHAAERRVLLAALSSADVAIAAEQRVSRAYKLASECRIVFGIKCPTRTQAFIAGAVVTVAAFVAVR